MLELDPKNPPLIDKLTVIYRMEHEFNTLFKKLPDCQQAGYVFKGKAPLALP